MPCLSWAPPHILVLTARNCFVSPILLAFLSRFRSKYHPDEVGKRRQEARGALQNRLKVFLSLMESGWFDNLLLDIDKADAIVKMLDAGMGLKGREVLAGRLQNRNQSLWVVTCCCHW
jgi:hypothetical protein